MENDPKFFASGIVREGDKYLTFFHKLKKEHPWRFAGGKVEPGEQPIAACARELYEEIGVVCKGLELITVSKPKDVDGARWTGFFYLVHPGNNGTWVIRELDKIEGAEYFTKEQLLERGCHPEYEVVAELEAWEKYKQELWEKPWLAKASPYGTH